MVAPVAPPGKRQLNSFLNEDAYDGLHAFAWEHAGNTTAFLDVLGVALAGVDKPPRWLEPICADARRLAASRKGRRPKR